jgi:voltage-gated potassium channel
MRTVSGSSSTHSPTPYNRVAAARREEQTMVNTAPAAKVPPLRTRSVAEERRLEEWERRAQLPILASALLPIVLSLAGTSSVLADTVMIVAWLVFIADLVMHVRLVPRYLRTGWGRFDLVVVVLTAPWFLIPGLGSARFLMLARLARLVRVVKAGGKQFTDLARQLGRLGVVLAVLIVTCSYVAYSVERATNPLFNSFGTSVWWAIVTITTVGYGDVYPITPAGRITGVVLMVAGVALIGVLAGTLASFFGFGATDPDAPRDEGATPSGPSSSTGDLEARLVELERVIAEVRRELQGA